VSKPKSTLAAYTLVILKIGLTSFGGGVSGWMMRVVVHEREWLTESEFLSGLALCQVLPGVNVLNLAIWLGYRLHGTAGAIAGALAMLLPPGFVLLGMAYAFAGLPQYPPVRNALAGVVAGAIGLTAAMGIRATRRGATNPAAALITAAIFVAIGVLHWPLIPVILAAAPISIGLAFARTARAR
jgi:chromate transporter